MIATAMDSLCTSVFPEGWSGYLLEIFARNLLRYIDTKIAEKCS